MKHCIETKHTDWQHPLVKKGTVAPIMGETTPFVFKDRLYRLENWQKFMEIPRATCGERYMEDVVRIWDVEKDQMVSVPLVGHSFAASFVWDNIVYVFAAAHPANNQWRTVTEITLTTSDDLVNWTPPEVVLQAESGEHLFNVAVCRGTDGFIMLYETDDQQWPKFTFKYCASDDLRHWTLIPDAVYGREKYVGGPALYYEGDWYYTLYLQDLGGKWETRITRSHDLVHWEDAPVDRPFLTFDEGRIFQYWQHNELCTVQEINASDAELCEWQGKTIVYFNGGDQQSAGDLQLAVFEGSPQQLFETFFAEPPVYQPSTRQLAFQERQFGAFIHFGMATWYDGPETAVFPETLRHPYAFNLYQWGSMTAQPPAVTFDPSELDAAQWMVAAKAMGAHHVVLTAKHHNGFCLWPTSTTDYSVRNSPWRNGKGDVLAEFAAAAREAGLGVGIYISAGDVHHGCFSTPEPQGQRRLIGDTTEYQPIFAAQFREVLSGYGELCEIWLDGALDPFGPDVCRTDGSCVGTALWDELISMAREMQPNAVIMGGTQPDVRWPGNEDGLAPYPLWNVVAPGEEAANYLPVGVTGWLVPEADVFTRPSWFWTPDSDDKLLSLERLRDIYMRSIGHGANLLINMTPDRRGRIPDAEVFRLSEFGDDIRIRFDHPLADIASEGCWREGMTIELAWDNPCVVNSLVLEEDLQYGQRIGEYCIDAQVDGAWQRVLDGTTIGCRYIASLEPVVTKRLRLRVLDSLPLPKIRRFAAFGEK
jgi:alpha-L-fucosidase